MITCNFVLHHPADPLAFLRSIRDRFPHAPLLLTEGLYPNWMHELPGWLRSSVWRPPVDYPRDVTQWSARALSIALRRSGYLAHTLIYAAPSADDVQLPLSVWAGRLMAARSRSGTSGHHQPLRIPGLSAAIRATLLLKRVLYAAHAAYATRRRLSPASVLALAYGERA